MTYLRYHYLLIFCRNCILLITQYFFIKLLTRTQSRKLYLNILTRTITCKFNHTSGQVNNLHSLPHLKDKNLITFTHNGSLHYQTTSFGNSHKETDDIGMSHCDRTTILYLFFKTGNYRTITTQYITKTSSDKFGMTFYFALTDGISQTLYIDLCQTFRTSHYIGRIYSLIGRNHDHFLSSVFHCHISNLARADNIDQYSFTGIFLHQWNMLVGSGMKNNLRMISLKNHTEAFNDTYISNDGNKVKIRIFFFKFKTYIMQRSFCRIEHY